eukprot:scaffold2852_cov303-Pavlova_lutheri.AAC.3
MTPRFQCCLRRSSRAPSKWFMPSPFDHPQFPHSSPRFSVAKVTTFHYALALQLTPFIFQSAMSRLVHLDEAWEQSGDGSPDDPSLGVCKNVSDLSISLPKFDRFGRGISSILALLFCPLGLLDGTDHPPQEGGWVVPRMDPV